MSRPLIALMTDFGLEDPYVGIMKGVMKRICPDAEFIDLTHQIGPQGVSEAAFMLSTCIDHFPPGTIFLCVVDPGVGSDRAAIVVEADGQFFVAPDNGLLTVIWQECADAEAHIIANPDLRLPEVSGTFHGRDIFAPAAAHLAAGRDLEDFGPKMMDIETIGLFEPLETGEGNLRGVVVHIDHFGNLVTNVRQEDLPEDLEPREVSIDVASMILTGLHHTYSGVDPGEPVIHWGSSGYLEVGLRNGDFATTHGVNVGDSLSVLWNDEAD